MVSDAKTYRECIAKGEFREQSKANKKRTSLACEENRLKIHPDKDNPEAYVWVNISKYQKWNNGKGYGKLLNYNGIFQILRKLKEKAGIKKKVHPHILRHSRLTHLAPKAPESFLGNIAGWSKDSTMPEIYVHLSDKDVDNTVLQNVYGFQIEELEEKEEKLIPKTCWNCGERNPFDVDFCLKCKFPLDKRAMKMRERQLLTLFTPEIIERLIEKKIDQMLLEKVGRRV